MQRSCTILWRYTDICHGSLQLHEDAVLLSHTSRVTALMSAPELISTFAIETRPYWAARCTGVTPSYSVEQKYVCSITAH